nr:helix-turn-helix transcriptional regulator [uncultured Blautia sp.]
MALSYDPLWKMLKEMAINKMEFAKSIGISNATLAKMGKNEPITLTTVDKICNEYHCKIEDVVQHIPDIKLNTGNSHDLEVGTILTIDSFNYSDVSVSTKQTKDKIQKHCYVIVKKEENPQMTFTNLIDNAGNYIYTLASVSSVSRGLTMPFPKISIDDQLTDGYILLGKIRPLSSGVTFHISGKMPLEVIDKLNRFYSFVDNFNKSLPD